MTGLDATDPDKDRPETSPAPAVPPRGRPRRSYQTGITTVWLRRAALAITLATSVALVAGYSRLPEQIPTHFNFSGEADQWGPKSDIWILIAIFTAIGVGMVVLSRVPHVFNYPSTITLDNAQAVYREGERMVVWVACGLSLTYLATALGPLLGLNGAQLIPFGIAGVLAATGVGIVRVIGASR